MITLECNYSKKLGLPGYSSHQFSITLRTEISDLTQIQPESARLYKLLQEGVDTSIKETGYLPASNGNGNGKGNGQAQGNNQSLSCDRMVIYDKHPDRCGASANSRLGGVTRLRVRWR